VGIFSYYVVTVYAVEVAGYREGGEIHANGESQELCAVPRLLLT